MMCAWEGKEFPANQFVRYRGNLYLHKVEPEHLTNGQLPDGTAYGSAKADISPAGPLGQADVSGETDEGDIH
jgi:hypothetical protein